MRALVLSLLLAPLLFGCASGGGGGAPSRSANLITVEELEQVRDLTAIAAIQRLRPNWLRSRSSPTPAAFQQGGTEPALHVDGVPRSGLEDLRTMAVQEVEEIRFMSASDATTRFGTGYVNGLIQVTTRQAAARRPGG